MTRRDTPPIHMTARMPTKQMAVVPKSDWVRYMSAMGAMMKMRARTMALHEPRPPIDDEAHGHQDEGDLAELRGLQPDRPDIEPALGAVMVGASEPHGEDERHGHGPHGPYNRPHPEAVGHDFPQEEGAGRAKNHI